MTESEVNFFDKIASHWDADEVRSTSKRVNAILDMLAIKPGMDVLDLGAGTGVLIPYLVNRIGNGGHIVAVDLSAGMLDIAKKKYGHYENVEFLKLDFEEEQIPGIYDLVLLYSVYPHLHYPKDTIDWLFRMNVKKGGRIVIAFPSDEKFINSIHHERKSESDHLLPAPRLAEMIQSWGYDTVVEADTPDAYVIVVSGTEDSDANTKE